jgi:uncharacterized protein (TIGR01777 family)
MRVTITGATGTIGRALVRELVARGDEVTALSRDPERATSTLGAETSGGGSSERPLDPEDPAHERSVETRPSQVEAVAWTAPKADPAPLDALRGRDGIVHLLGEPIAQRWTDEAKREILDSRVLGTRNLVAALATLPEDERPGVLVSQSASGWYGPHGEEPLDEAAPAGDSFEAGVVKAWEAEAANAELLGLRVARMRTGVVLSRSGGALEKMLPFFKLGVGGPVAGGRQYIPWVHLDDVVGALIFCLDDNAANGAINVTAPSPTTNAELSKALGRVLRRPALLPVPGIAVKALYGEMATIVISGANVLPARLEQLGYVFRRPELDAALRDAIRS